MKKAKLRPALPLAWVMLSGVMLVVIAIAPWPTWAQSASKPADGAHDAAQAGTLVPSAAQSPSTSSDDLAQMRTDLNQLEGLLGNMSAEIEFLRDQNLQILLRSNARMWTILIRDMRRQLDREDQQRNHR